MTADCKICGGSGYLRNDEEVDWTHPEFGKLVPCECRLKEFPELEKEEERDPDLSWLKYTE